jgi:VanZ family protein
VNVQSELSPALVNWLKLWLPVCLWALLMSIASTDTFSSEHTSRIILPLLQALLPHATAATLELTHFTIRKSTHFVEYFILSVLLLRAVRGNRGGWMIRWALGALVIAALFSMLDEFHQSFVPSRTASPWDSLLDTTGAAFAQLAAWNWLRSRQSRSASRSPSPLV